MPRLSHMEQRLEFLELGEKLGWPRIGHLRAGKGNWEGTARAEHRRFVPLLRAAKIRVENLHGEVESDLARTVLYGDVLKGLAEVQAIREEEVQANAAGPSMQRPTTSSSPVDVMVRPPKYTAAMRRANLAKAREAKKAKAAMA